MWRNAPPAWRATAPVRRPAIHLLRRIAPSGWLGAKVAGFIYSEVEAHREADRRYWSEIIDELKLMQRKRGLLRLGTTVASLL